MCLLALAAAVREVDCGLSGRLGGMRVIRVCGWGGGGLNRTIIYYTVTQKILCHL